MYVQTPDERADKVDSSVQRRLVDNMQLAQRMGADVVKLEGRDIAETLCQFALTHGVRLIMVGQSRRRWWQRFTRGSVVERLVRNGYGIDVQVVGFESDAASVATAVAEGR